MESVVREVKEENNLLDKRNREEKKSVCMLRRKNEKLGVDKEKLDKRLNKYIKEKQKINWESIVYRIIIAILIASIYYFSEVYDDIYGTSIVEHGTFVGGLVVVGILIVMSILKIDNPGYVNFSLDMIFNGIPLLLTMFAFKLTNKNGMLMDYVNKNWKNIVFFLVTYLVILLLFLE